MWKSGEKTRQVSGRDEESGKGKRSRGGREDKGTKQTS